MSKTKPTVLIQIDAGEHSSSFDSIVAIDSGVDQLLRYSEVEPLDVRDLVHGAMFTRGGESLKNTAIFVGGTNVQTGEQILRNVTECFFGPVRVSVMLDANGANTTAAAAVLCLEKHLELSGQTVAVLAATGSVGQRVCWLLARNGCHVRIASRNLERAEKVRQRVLKKDSSLSLTAFETGQPHGEQKLLEGCDAMVSAGAAGIELITEPLWTEHTTLKMAVDLNAVPPAGIQGVDAMDAGAVKFDKTVYGAIGVGNLKMKIHRRCIQRLFESNNAVLDVDEIYAIGRQIVES